LAAGFRPDSLGELTALPRPSSWITGVGPWAKEPREGEGRKGGKERGKEGRKGRREGKGREGRREGTGWDLPRLK